MLDDRLAELDTELVKAAKKPQYLPPWLTQKDALTAYLAFSVFANAVQLHELTEEEFTGGIF